MGILIHGLIGGNMTLLFNQSKPDAGGNEKVIQDESSLSVEDVIYQNNQELLKVVDTRNPVIFVLYGTDEKTDEAGRSDIIMVVKYDPTERKLTMASLPRDLRVNVPGYGLDKINHAYAYGGRKLSDQTIEELLGIKLDFSINLDFDTFSKIIDDMDGVSVNAKKNYYYNQDNSLAIKEGEQILNGRDALFYVRFRNDEEGDYGRIARQQEVIKSLTESLSSTSLKQKIKLIKTYYNNGLQTNISKSEIEEYATMSSGDNNINFENYRLQTYSEIINGLWYELYNQEDLEIIKNLFNDQDQSNTKN